MKILDGKEIQLDLNDWSSITELCSRSDEFDAPLFGRNESGETILISVNSDNVTVETFQNNGWTRENIYWVEDYSVEELFHR